MLLRLNEFVNAIHLQQKNCDYKFAFCKMCVDLGKGYPSKKMDTILYI